MYELRSSMTCFMIMTKQGGSHSVNLESGDCTCMWFQHLGIPCPHACLAINVAGLRHISYVDEYYTIKNWLRTYQEVWIGIPSKEQWEINEENDRILPPELRRRPGRPPMERIRIPPQRKGPKQRRCCTLCNQHGHNRSTCKYFNDDKGASKRSMNQETVDKWFNI
ncbi:hypothetical protein IFM89_026634 [Coptis chinensis]|uniref:SWIM-type domain-containing protein n=1 Tax=Coptis chinensis TaxID=261450 RepID=A0A835H122_9MAGN|nr:hypothetical protein IFM89_026634 [Coptis chinensis]